MEPVPVLSTHYTFSVLVCFVVSPSLLADVGFSVQPRLDSVHITLVKGCSKKCIPAPISRFWPSSGKTPPRLAMRAKP